MSSVKCRMCGRSVDASYIRLCEEGIKPENGICEDCYYGLISSFIVLDKRREAAFKRFVESRIGIKNPEVCY